MSKPDLGFETDRDTRAAALSVLTERYGRLRGALAERGPGARAADHAKGKARAAAREALDVANNSRGIIAGTAALLALWFCRKPIMAQAARHWPGLRDRLASLTAFLDTETDSE